MNIKLEQYKVFYSVANSGSFSEAAKQLYITQSAVSQQIHQLEEELGAILFVRSRKGAKLTSQGELLYTYAGNALKELGNAEMLFKRMKSLDDGELRIGAGDTITRHFLLNFLERFHNKYPGIKIEIVNRVTDETLARLSSGSVDVAFVNLPIDKNSYNNIDVREVGQLHDIFIAGDKYIELKNKTLSAKDIASLPLVMLEPMSNTRKTIDEFFHSNGHKLTPEFELGSYDLLFDFASRNLGIACVTKEFFPNIEDLNIFELKTDFTIPPRSIGICTLKNVASTPAVVKLIEMAEEI